MKAKKSAVPKKPVKKAAKKPVKTEKKRVDLKDFISSALDGDKAKDIVCLDMKGKNSITDFMIVATGTSSRHVVSTAQKLKEKLNAEYKIKAHIEGQGTGDWVIVDAGDVIVHLFREEVREFYNLEKLWGSDFSTVMYTRYQSV